jgi:hypothetical protein
MKRDHISARTTYVMWREERLWNVGVLQRVRLSSIIVVVVVIIIIIIIVIIIIKLL